MEECLERGGVGVVPCVCEAEVLVDWLGGWLWVGDYDILGFFFFLKMFVEERLF